MPDRRMGLGIRSNHPSGYRGDDNRIEQEKMMSKKLDPFKDKQPDNYSVSEWSALQSEALLLKAQNEVDIPRRSVMLQEAQVLATLAVYYQERGD